MIKQKLRNLTRIVTDPVYRFRSLGERGFYNRLSDEKFICRMFKQMMGYRPNLEEPRTFNEKLQWLKLHDRKPIYTTMVDKYAVKDVVASIIGEEYIIPTLGVWDSFDEIDFDTLPEQFVLKCTHDSGGLVICRDKSKLDIPAARNKINKALKRNYFYYGREWSYKDIKPRIIAEVYLEQGDSLALVDYKFFCFNGIPYFLYISKGLEHHPTAQIGFYDMDGNEMPFCRKDFSPLHNAVIPNGWDDMKFIAEKLAKEVDCPFVRIDLYSICGHIYFSEITFYPCSGMLPFDPPEWDYKLGSMIQLPGKSEKEI